MPSPRRFLFPHLHPGRLLPITEEDFRTLDRIVDEMKTSIENGGKGFSDLDLSFHIAIAKASKNEILTEMLEHIREGLQELIRKSLLLPAGMELAYKQHRKLLEVLKQRNPAKARNAVHTHLRSFQRGYKVLFQAPPIAPPCIRAGHSARSKPKTSTMLFPVLHPDSHLWDVVA